MRPHPTIGLCSLLALTAACTTTPPERQSSAPAGTAPAGSGPATLAVGQLEAPTASASATAAATVDPSTIARISPEQAHAKVQAGEALLVCAYGDRSKCGGMKLEGSMAYADFAETLPELDKDREIILYCA